MLCAVVRLKYHIGLIHAVNTNYGHIRAAVMSVMSVMQAHVALLYKESAVLLGPKTELHTGSSDI